MDLNKKKKLPLGRSFFLDMNVIQEQADGLVLVCVGNWVLKETRKEG